ncbi:MAG: twin-arginine translocase TatA/TatE family subunit [Propionibacteriaceae bacterium]|nr:twin-arginine translocase TatA/TatE family subunit [Propionibacteriaceae bacterium]
MSPMVFLFSPPGGMEWLIILAIAVLLFGGAKLAGIGKGAGRAIREFKDEISADSSSDSESEKMDSDEASSSK